jgi:putative transposase
MMTDKANIINMSPKPSGLEIKDKINDDTAFYFWRENKHLKVERKGVDHYWARGCYVSTVCVDEDLIRTYIHHQEKEKKKKRKEGLEYDLFFGMKV